jgi:hypothetical protein
MSDPTFDRLWDDAFAAVQRALAEGGDLPDPPVSPDAPTQERAIAFLKRYIALLHRQSGVVPAATATARFPEAGPILHRILGAYEDPENARRLMEGVDPTLDACAAFLFGVWGPPSTFVQFEAVLAAAAAMRTGWLLGLWSGATAE